ncbi:MAG: FIST C-terminal domain-containing protein [Bdellovibrionales bacterium]|nr:FIST C-terminal domain-containing protein [Bdellovibrionales bacterium]
MRTQQFHWNSGRGWNKDPEQQEKIAAQLVFVFGSRGVLRNDFRLEQIQKWYPGAYICGCSTAGEICGTEVSDDSLVVTALEFSKSRVQGAKYKVSGPEQSFDAGKALAQELQEKDLTHVIVLSEGLHVNGTELVNGFRTVLPAGVTVTGGLSGDGANFQETVVVADERAECDTIAAIGVYGDKLRVSYASLGGWDRFGPERLVTRSEGNVLYELEGKSALELYKSYLGEHAEGLPATGLLFPLCVRTDKERDGVVRTILSVDEEAQSITFAGDIPQGSYAQFMMANFDRLIDGAGGAAKNALIGKDDFHPEFALLVSCVGRKMVLQQRVEEEVEGVQEVLGDQAVLTGFYSYGEISPFTPDAVCELHNQTMTITAFQEVE